MSDDNLFPSPSPAHPPENSESLENHRSSTTDPLPGSLAPSRNGPAAAPAETKRPAKSEPASLPKDTTREITETVVFVIVLVLLLKTFIAEAFVIPTGSMASTLWGYQKVVTCPQCGHTFPVNCSSEVDPQSDRSRTPVVGCTCPNCRLIIDFTGVDEGPIHIPPKRDNVDEGDNLLLESSSGRDPFLTVPFIESQGGLRPLARSELDQGVRPAFLGRELNINSRGEVMFDGRPYKVHITIDGKPDQGVEDLRNHMIARVRYKLSDRGPLPVLDIDAHSSGKPTQKFEAFNPMPNSGDRVLVAKFLYDSGLRDPERHDVVVFKYPVKPEKNYVALNYIKRFIGKPDETIGIHAGKLYASTLFSYPSTEGLPRGEVRRLGGLQSSGEEDFRLSSESEAYLSQLREILDQAEKQLSLDVHRPNTDPKRLFHIIHKKPEVMLALRRIVYDNDQQAADLVTNKLPPRWSAASGWNTDKPQEPKVFSHAEGGELTWLRYRHLIPDDERQSAHAQLITDFMGYNTGRPNPMPSPNWASDLMLEGDLDITSTTGELWLEVSKGIDRFQARFKVETGACTLVRLQGTAGRTPTEIVLATKPTNLKGPGKYHVRFANVDERLTLWINDTLPFDEGAAYDPPPTEGPTKENDIDRPASIGVKGAAVKVEHLQIWRDTYYTTDGSSADVDLRSSLESNPDSKDGWLAPPENTHYRTMYVQPEHYLCLGDNSPESSDGRYWGLVPKRLMLGRALVVYYPFKWPYTWPHNPVNRVGLIH